MRSALLALSLLAAECPPRPTPDVPITITSTNAVQPVIDTRVAPADPWSADLPVRLIGQETPMWCWAASTQMALAIMGATVTQCAQANDRLGRSDCCSLQRCPPTDSSGPCVQGGWPHLEAWGFTAQETAWGSALTFESMSTEIQGGRPVLFAWGWEGGGGHLMLARGVSRVDGVEYVLLNDPWPPCQGGGRAITFEEFEYRSGDHVHWKDYYGLKRTTGAVATTAGGSNVLVPSATAPSPPPPAPTSSPARSRTGPRGSPILASPQEAARASLKALSKGERTQVILGLEPGDTTGSAVAVSVPDFLVRLDELKAYTPGADPAPLLHDTGSLVLPVMVGGRVRSAVTVAKVEGGYRTVSVGDESMARALAIHGAPSPGAGPEELLIVRVPAMRLIFVARRRPGPLMLVPLADDVRLGLKAGTAVPAATLFERLAPMARQLAADKPG
jgi:hypothetical protein